MLQDEKLEYIQEQFEEKNMVLAAFGERVSAATMYEDVYGSLDVEVPVVVIDEDGTENIDKHIVPMTLEEALEQCSDRSDMLVGGCTYFNNWISKASARDVHTLIIDMDNVYSGTLQNALAANWATANGEQLPMPTYIVNSGTGCHLYFVFDEKIPNYKITTPDLDRLYRALAVQQTTKRVYLQRQVQWFGQDFRMAGGLNKYNWENTVFRVGEKWNPDELAKAVGLDVHFTRYGEKRKRKPTEEAKKKRRGRRKSGWHTSRAFYDSAVRGCREKTREGNRYTSMCALSVIAWKCGVLQEELEQDLLSLLPDFNKGAKRTLKQKEIYSAMKMYNPKAMLTPRERLEHWQGWEYKPIPRNGQKRAEHLEEARAIRDIRMRRQGRKWDSENGRKPKKEQVLQLRAEHPEASISELAKISGMSRTTLYKYLGKQ